VSHLYEIPKSWNWTTLDEVFLIERGGSPRPIKSFITDADDGINWIKIGDVKKGKKYVESTQEKIKPEGLKKSRLVIEGDFILSNSMSFGRPYIVKTRGAIHDGWLVFRDVTKVLDKDFFYYLLSSTYIYEQFSRNASGSTVKNLNIEIVKQTNISLPPLKEQKRIVTKIEKLFSNLDNSDKYLVHLEKQLKRYRQSVLKSAFEGELTREWREKQTDLESAEDVLEKIKLERIEYIEEEVRKKFQDKTEKWIITKVKKEFDKFYNGLKDIENIEKPFDIPQKWQWIQWEQILKYGDSSFRRGPFGSSLKKAFFIKENTYKVYEQYCPINDDCSFERYYISEDKFIELKNFEVKEKDYLISCSGSIGKITQIPQEYKKGVINQALLRVRINDAFYLDKFFITLFRSKFFQENIIDNSTGSAMINVKGVKELKALPLPMVSVKEQEEIIKEIERHFSIIDKLEAVVQKSIKESKRLRQSILKQAFEGKLVKQDPNDESAEKLLEKIAKAKEEYKKQMKKGKKK
jgi:type I restriction enzyme S subunit